MRYFYRNKLFRLEKRGPYYYVRYKNPKTGKRLSAISTRKTDFQEAELQSYKWLSEGIPDSDSRKTVDLNKLLDFDTFIFKLKNIEFSPEEIELVLKTFQN